MADAVPNVLLLLPRLRRLLGQPGAEAVSDGRLIESFQRHRDETAFAELVRRHGPMVLGVCRNILHNVHDAEDAFQAAFLVLARKAGSIRRQEAVAGFLYRVASHIAGQAAARTARRPHCLAEVEKTDMKAGDPLLDLTVRELRQALYEELERLPEKHRVPLVLCYLEGRTQDEAARELGCPKGALRGRLIRGREKLRARLARRGLAPSAELVAFGLTPTAAISQALLGGTVKAALHFGHTAAAGVSAPAAALAEGALRVLFGVRLKAGIGLLLAGLFAATGALAYQGFGPATGSDREPVAAESGGARLDAFGDPLPAEAISRLGTVRFRHAGAVGFLSFTPDGKVLVSQGPDGARTWEVATGKQLHLLAKGMTGGLAWDSASLSADGKLLASPSIDGVRLWQVGTGQLLGTFGEPKCLQASLSPDGKSLVLLSWGARPVIELWEVGTGRKLWTIDVEHPMEWRLRFIADGKTVIMLRSASVIGIGLRGGDSNIRFLDAATGRKQREIDLSSESPGSFALSPDGARLAVVCSAWGKLGSACRIRMWETASGKELLPLKAPTAEAGREPYFLALAFGADGKSLFAAGSEDAILVWDVATGKPQRRFGTGIRDARALAVSADGKAVAVGHSSGWIRVIDSTTGVDLAPAMARRPYPGRTAPDVDVSGQEDWPWLTIRSSAHRSAISLDGRTVVTTARNHFILWDSASGRERRQVEIPASSTAPVLADDGRTALLFRARDNTLVCWDLAAGKERSRLSLDFLGEPPPEGPRSVPFSDIGDERPVKGIGAGGKKVVVASWADETLYLLDTTTGRRLQRFKPTGKVGDANVTADGRLLVTHDREDHTARVWDIASGALVRQLAPPQKEPPRGLANGLGSISGVVSPDGNWVAFGTFEGGLVLFDVATGKLVHGLGPRPGGVAVVVFSLDSRILAWSGWSDGVIHLLETATNKERHTLTGHAGPVKSLTFSADGRTLVSCSADTTALVWDLTGQVASRGSSQPLSATELNACWDALAGNDAGRAHQAMRKLTTSPAEALPCLRERLHPVEAPSGKRLAAMIADLDSDQFQAREKASRELEQLGDGALSACREALANRPSTEKRHRLQALIDRQEQEHLAPSPAGLRVLRAIEVLELIATAEARQHLETLAAGASEARLTREARATLDRLSRRVAAP
jgi:RNA polymerase sigma factor (sigma-70 family)